MSRRITATVFIFIALLVLCGCGRQTEDEMTTPPKPPQSDRADMPSNAEPADETAEKPMVSTPEEAEPVEYQVISGERGDKDLTIGEYHSDNVDIDAAKRYARDIIVPRDTSDEQIAATLHRALDDFRDTHPDADALVVNVAFEGSTGTNYGRLIWAADGGDAWGEQSGTLDLALTPRPPEEDEGERFGLSLEERKQIFQEMTDAEDRAREEAWEKYPDSDDFAQRIEMEDTLLKKYQEPVRQTYGFTEDQWGEIMMEGIEQRWPTASSPGE